MRLGVVDQLDRRPRLWAAVAVALTLAAAPLLMSLGVDNSIEGWIDRDSEAFSAYQEFLDAFGSEEYILVIYSLPADFDLAFLERLTDLRWTLEEISGVRGVRCLSEIYSRGFGLLGIEAFRRDLLESPFYRDFMVSADRGSGEGHRAAMWVELEGRELRDSTAIVAQVEAATREAAPGEEIYLAGSPIIDQALDEGSRRASRTFFPLVFLLSAALLLCFFPHPYGVLIPFCSVGAGIVWILGLMALSGSSLNMVTVALPPLLWVLGLSTSIHLLSRCRQLLAAGAELDEAIPRAMGELARPCCSSAITTALGFGSLIASSMQPVREMGLFASLGILLGLSSNFLLFPCLARLFPPLPAESSANHHPVLAALGLFIERRPRTIAILAGVMGLTHRGGAAGTAGRFERDLVLQERLEGRRHLPAGARRLHRTVLGGSPLDSPWRGGRARGLPPGRPLDRGDRCSPRSGQGDLGGGPGEEGSSAGGAGGARSPCPAA